MTYASTSASFVGRTNAAAICKPLPGFRTNKRTVRSTACKPLSSEARRETFEEMFVASRPKFVAMARTILRNREDAEDAVQNAFLSGCRHLRSFEGRSALTTWFTRIVFNAALMIQRKRKSSRIRPIPETGDSRDDDWTQSIPTSRPDPEMACAERETVQLINGMLGKMKPALRQAFTMTYYDELSGREASVLLGVTAGTFKARLFRARRQLLSQAQRTLAAPVRMTTHSAFFPDKNAFQTIVARRSDIASSEGSIS